MRTSVHPAPRTATVAPSAFRGSSVSVPGPIFTNRLFAAPPVLSKVTVLVRSVTVLMTNPTGCPLTAVGDGRMRTNWPGSPPADEMKFGPAPVDRMPPLVTVTVSKPSIRAFPPSWIVNVLYTPDEVVNVWVNAGVTRKLVPVAPPIAIGEVGVSTSVLTSSSRTPVAAEYVRNPLPLPVPLVSPNAPAMTPAVGVPGAPPAPGLTDRLGAVAKNRAVCPGPPADDEF